MSERRTNLGSVPGLETGHVGGASSGVKAPELAAVMPYLQNQPLRMNSPEYRRQGLPITSNHIESTVKLLNHRVKGTETFWSESAAEALLQLKAATLSDTAPLERFWHHRPARMTGSRPTKTAAA